MIARSECLRIKSWTIKKVFFAQFDTCGRFSQVDSTLWADLRCPQFAFLRWSHFQERIPYIWIRELKGLKLCVRNFQVVAFVRWSQGQVQLYFIASLVLCQPCVYTTFARISVSVTKYDLNYLASVCPSLTP